MTECSSFLLFGQAFLDSFFISYIYNTIQIPMIQYQQHPLSIQPITNTSQLDLFSLTKQALVKKINILTHQLMIHHQMKTNQLQLNQLTPNEVKMQLTQKEIIISTLTDNHAKLQAHLQTLSNSNKQLREALSHKETIVSQHRKEVQVYKKKIDQLQRKKSIHNRQKESKIQNDNRCIEELKNENIKLRQSLLQLKNKIKILNAMNQETEEKLAEELVKSIQSVNKKGTIQQEDKENLSIKANNTGHSTENDVKSKQIFDNVRQDSSLKIENLSLRQQLRQIRQHLRLSEASKQSLRKKIDERQLFYSKMLSNKR